MGEMKGEGREKEGEKGRGRDGGKKGGEAGNGM